LPKRVLLVDSYDSFVENVAHALAALGARVDVLAVDHPSLNSECIRGYDAVVLGPGPGAPRKNDGLARTIGWALDADRPLLGICLGMQAIAHHYGAQIVRAPHPLHGELAGISHDASGLFAGIPTPFSAMRYHSLCIAPGTLPPALRANAFSDDGVIQAIRDEARPVCAVQFHPESFLSEHGHAVLANFLAPVRTP
jgi:anthranilate synthase/aminodeoxychorismate synthase-like glutamine amidotransferase